MLVVSSISGGLAVTRVTLVGDGENAGCDVGEPWYQGQRAGDQL